MKIYGMEILEMAKAYEMEMIFSASVGFKQLNNMLKQCYFDERVQVKDALSISIRQVLPVIPDEAYLSKVAEIIKENYETDDLNIIECHFTGYKYLREISVKGDAEDGK